VRRTTKRVHEKQVYQFTHTGADTTGRVYHANSAEYILT